MARTAATRTHYVPAGTTVTGGTRHVDYVIEMLQGQVRWTAGRIMGSVRNGRGAMPAVGTGWSDEQVLALTSYLKENPPSGS